MSSLTPTNPSFTPIDPIQNVMIYSRCRRRRYALGAKDDDTNAVTNWMFDDMSALQSAFAMHESAAASAPAALIDATVVPSAATAVRRS